MKTFLITGGAGFIGSNFIIYLLGKYRDIKIINYDKLTYAGNPENLKSVENDARYFFVKGDICDNELLNSVFREHEIHCVVNFAAESHVDRSISNPDIFVKTNVLGTLSLLNVSKKFWQTGDDLYKPGVKFVQMSTDEVYGSLGATGYFTEQTPLDPHSPYSASKASADLLVKSYFDTYKFPVNIARCSNNFGPFQFPEKLIPLVINNALKHSPLPIYGDGMQIRDWLYVEDCCSALDLVIHKGEVGEIYNVGANNELTNISLVKTIVNYLNKHADTAIGEHLITYTADRKGHDRRYAIDSSKIKTQLGWKPRFSFQECIEQTIRWYLSNTLWLENINQNFKN